MAYGHSYIVLNGSNGQLTTNTVLQFRDDSVGATSWSWEMEGIVFSTSQNPIITNILPYVTKFTFPIPGPTIGAYLDTTLTINGGESVKNYQISIAFSTSA